MKIKSAIYEYYKCNGKLPTLKQLCDALSIKRLNCLRRFGMSYNELKHTVLVESVLQRPIQTIIKEREKRAIQNEQLMSCAVLIAKRDGLEAVSIKRLAAEMGLSPLTVSRRIVKWNVFLSRVAWASKR